MRALIRASVGFRVVVVAVAAGLLALAAVQLRGAPVDVLPEFTPPYAEIQTEALGLSAAEVEELITVPLEADLLNGVQGVDVIRSESVPSLSSIVLVFEPGTDVYRARQLVQERLIQAHALPNVSKPPTLLQPLSSTSRVMMIGLSSEDLSPIERSVIARWTVRPRLMGVPGVANVALWGLRDQQLQVLVDPARLRDRGVTLNQVVRTAGNAQAVSPLTFLEASTPGTGGFIETPQQRLQVRNVLEQLADPEQLGRVPVEGTGGRLRLSDVTDVTIDHQPLIGDAVVDGGQGLLLVVEKFPGASTLEVTEGVEDALEELRPGLAGLQTDMSVFRPATFIEVARDNLTLALVIGVALAALALASLLFQWRTVLVVLVVVPVSLAAAALALVALGETINAISFAGLALAVVVVVDEAVTGAENVLRRLREDRSAGGGGKIADVVVTASAEMRGPLAYATLIALLAILPVAVMEGRAGAFFAPLALAYAVAVGAAMLVALTVTPALSVLLLSAGRSELRLSPLSMWAHRRYDRLLKVVLRRHRPSLLAAGAVGIAALAALPFMGASPVPSFKDRDLLVRLDSEPGTSVARMTEVTAELSRELRSLPGIDNVGAHVGRAVTGDQVVDVNSSELWVSVDAGADYGEVVDNIHDVVGQAPAVRRDVVTYTAQRIRDIGSLEEGGGAAARDGFDVLTGVGAPLTVRVYGEELEELQAQAARVEQLMEGIDGVVDPQVEQPVRQPSLEIEVDLERAQALGVKPGDVRRAESTLLQGIQVGSVFEDQKVFDVVVRGVPESRAGVASVRNLLIDRPGGGHLRLRQVAEVREVPTPIAIEREAVSRRLDVTTAVTGRDVSAVADDIRARLASTVFPLEYHAEVVERTTGGEIGATRMIVVALGAALAAFLLLQAAFRSWMLALLVVAVLPVALSGGVLAAFVDGGDLSLGALAGLLAVLVLAVRFAVLLIRSVEETRIASPPFVPAHVRCAAADRFTAVLATTAAIAVMMLPFVALGTRPGLEVVQPMAVVLVGGLMTSLLASLVVLPVLYARFGVRDDTVQPGPSAAVRQWQGIGAVVEEGPVVATGNGSGGDRNGSNGSSTEDGSSFVEGAGTPPREEPR